MCVRRLMDDDQAPGSGPHLDPRTVSRSRAAKRLSVSESGSAEAEPSEEGWEVPQEERCDTPHLSDDSEQERWEEERRKQRRRPYCRPRFGPDGCFVGVTPIDGRGRRRERKSVKGTGIGTSSSSDDSGRR